MPGRLRPLARPWGAPGGRGGGVSVQPTSGWLAGLSGTGVLPGTKMGASLRGGVPLRGGLKSWSCTILVLERNSISRISQFSSPEVDLVLEREGRSRPSPALDSQAVSGCRTSADATRLRTPTGLISRDGARVLGPGVPGGRRCLRRAVGHKGAVTTAM